MRPVLLLGAVLGVVCACSYPRPTPLPEPERFVVPAPMDTVFRASLATLVRRNFVIAFADRGSGVISTIRQPLSNSVDTVGLLLYRGTNCGERPAGMGPLGLPGGYTVRLSILIESLGADSAALRISPFVSTDWSDLLDPNANPVTICQTSGLLERMLASEIRRRVTGDSL